MHKIRQKTKQNSNYNIYTELHFTAVQANHEVSSGGGRLMTRDL